MASAAASSAGGAARRADPSASAAVIAGCSSRRRSALEPQVRGLLAHLVVEAAGRLGRGDVILEGVAQRLEGVDDLGLPRHAVAHGRGERAFEGDEGFAELAPAAGCSLERGSRVGFAGHRRGLRLTGGRVSPWPNPTLVAAGRGAVVRGVRRCPRRHCSRGGATPIGPTTVRHARVSIRNSVAARRSTAAMAPAVSAAHSAASSRTRSSSSAAAPRRGQPDRIAGLVRGGQGHVVPLAGEGAIARVAGDLRDLVQARIPFEGPAPLDRQPPGGGRVEAAGGGDHGSHGRAVRPEVTRRAQGRDPPATPAQVPAVQREEGHERRPEEERHEQIGGETEAAGGRRVGSPRADCGRRATVRIRTAREPPQRQR